jgi:hypothetical protein
VAYERREGRNKVSLEIEPLRPDDTQPIMDWSEFLAKEEGKEPK